MKAGRQHLWDFDTSPQNKLATLNAGPPVRKGNKAPNIAKKKNSVDLMEASDDDVPEPAEAAEMVWWEYGLGPKLTDARHARKATAGKGGGHTGGEEDTYQYDKNGENADSHDIIQQHISTSLRRLITFIIQGLVRPRHLCWQVST